MDFDGPMDRTAFGGATFPISSRRLLCRTLKSTFLTFWTGTVFSRCSTTEPGQRPAAAGLPDPPPRFSNYRTVLVEGSMTKDDALAQSLATEGGISNVSRIANAVEETKEETASDHDHDHNLPEHTKLDPKL